MVRMPPPFQWIHKGQANEAHTNPPNEMRHLGMAEWPTRIRTQEMLEKECAQDGEAYETKDESRATGKSRHHVE